MKKKFEHLQYCIRCHMPETQEGLIFDEMGICRACISSEQKMHIDWDKKEKSLRKILEHEMQNAGNNYDCIVPISGGKDSVYQLHVLTKIYNMRVLTVTFSHNWYSEIGWYNLTNCLEQFEVDHIMYTPNRKLISKTARNSLQAIGDSCWHCHAGISPFVLNIAIKFGIKLVVWGESISEQSGRSSHKDKVTSFDADYFTKVSAKKTPKEMAFGDLTRRELSMFENPTIEECEEAGVYGIHLGDYIFWDEERQTEFIKRHYAWKETEVEGAYKKYKSAECIMPGVHDFTCYLKRGYGRTTYQAASDVRNGIISQEEADELIRLYDSERPHALDYFLEITDYSEEEFHDIMKSLKHEKLKNIDIPVEVKTSESNKSIKPFVISEIERIKEQS